MAGRARIGWRHLLLAPLLFSFLQNTALSPIVGTDVGLNPANPVLFFSGFLFAALAVDVVAFVRPRARKALLAVPVAVYLLLLLFGTALPCAFILVGFGSTIVLPCGGAVFGFVGAVLFLMWCDAYARLEPGVLVRTAALACVLTYLLDVAYELVPNGPVVSLAVTFVAVFVSAIPLEGLRREATGAPAVLGRRRPADSNAADLRPGDRHAAECRAGDYHADDRGTADGCVPASPEALPVKTLLSRGWPVLAAAFIAYMVTGFSWGNAIFGAFEFFETVGSPVLNVGRCAGAVVVALWAGRRRTRASMEWLLSFVVGLLLVSWLVSSSLGPDGAAAVALLTGVAFGLIDATLLIWACGGWGEGAPAVRYTSAFAALSVLAPVCLGIALSPLLHGVAATLATPLCSVVFFVVLQATAPRRARRDSRETVTASLRNDLMEMSAAAGLSPRETDVFLKLAMGHSSSYIAEELGVSSYTVKTHVKHIYAKMGVHSKDEFLSAVAPGGAGKA